MENFFCPVESCHSFVSDGQKLNNLFVLHFVFLFSSEEKSLDHLAHPF